MPELDVPSGGTTRREFVRDAGIATVVVAELANPALAEARKRSRRHRVPSRPTVAVFGGGVAGLTAAHELAERGFDVTVFERRAWGGKARSTEVLGSAKGGRRPLPGEHGFRLEFGFYRNLPDTMRRIPQGSGAKTVFDNLIEAQALLPAREGRPDFYLPTDPREPMSIAPDRIVGTLIELFANPDLPPHATAYFASRVVVYLSSCDARRREQWENVSWTKFIAADRYGGDYKLFDELPRIGQASKPSSTSTDWIGQGLEAILYCLTGRGDGPLLRLLDGPTNDKWIVPWLEHLRSLGVKLRLGEAVEALNLEHCRINGAHIRGTRGRRVVHADWYLCALPVERARRLWNPHILAADPRLRQMNELQTAWMNGMKLFLSEQRPIVKGFVGYVDEPWAISSVSQAQFWERDFASTYGDGHVRESLSVIVSDWDAPGVVYGKPARRCTPEQVIHEVWEQIKRSVNKPGQAPVLTDDLLLSWNIDPGMTLHNGHLVSGDPMITPTVGSRPHRPDVATAIPNLLLAGDYPLSDSIDGTMEAANETARLAVNAILARAGSRETRATVFPHFRPPEWEPLKQIDQQRYGRGQPNLFDTNLTAAQLSKLLGATGHTLRSRPL